MSCFLLWTTPAPSPSPPPRSTSIRKETGPTVTPKPVARRIEAPKIVTPKIEASKVVAPKIVQSSFRIIEDDPVPMPTKVVAPKIVQSSFRIVEDDPVPMPNRNVAMRTRGEIHRGTEHNMSRPASAVQVIEPHANIIEDEAEIISNTRVRIGTGYHGDRAASGVKVNYASGMVEHQSAMITDDLMHMSNTRVRIGTGQNRVRADREVKQPFKKVTGIIEHQAVIIDKQHAEISWEIDEHSEGL